MNRQSTIQNITNAIYRRDKAELLVYLLRMEEDKQNAEFLNELVSENKKIFFCDLPPCFIGIHIFPWQTLIARIPFAPEEKVPYKKFLKVFTEIDLKLAE